MIVESRIDRVKVYERGATVVRSVEVPATDAPAVEIPGLPLALVDATVRVRVDEAEGGELVAGEVRIGLYVKPREHLAPDPDEDELERLERALLARRRVLEQIDVEMSLLASIGVPERPQGEEGKPPPASPLAARVALEQLTDEAVSARLVEARALRDEVAKLDEDAAAARDRLDRARAGRRIAPDEISKTVIVALRRGGAPFTRARLTLEYFVPGARWAPQYQLRIARGGESATIVLRAVVAQRSGEDWRGVKLWLSTAQPTSWTELPKLSSIRIGRAQPEPSRVGFRPPPQGARALFADFDRDRGQTSAPPRARWRPPHLAVAPLLPLSGPSPSADVDDEVTASARDRGGHQRSEGRVPVAAAPMAMAAVPPPGFAPRSPAAASAARSPPVPALGKAASRKGRSADPRAMPEPVELLALEEVEAPPEPTRPRAAFAELCLGAPDSHERGLLRSAERRESYTELLDRARLAWDFDPMTAVEQAERLAAAAADTPLPAGTVDPRSSAGAWDYAYPSDDRVDVPSDGTFHSIPLGARDAPCALSYVVVPREDQNVFRVAAIENPTRAPLLPGPVEVYVEGEYVLTSDLPSVAPRERFRLGLGVEQAIKCARNTKFREQRSGVAVVAMAELWHAIDVRLVNRLSVPIQCEVRERIPQPARDAEVVVEEVSVTPAWEVWDQRDRGPVLTGGRRWLVLVPAGGEQTLTAEYVVKIYANNELAGGNRREV